MRGVKFDGDQADLLSSGARLWFVPGNRDSIERMRLRLPQPFTHSLGIPNYLHAGKSDTRTTGRWVLGDLALPAYEEGQLWVDDGFPYPQLQPPQFKSVGANPVPVHGGPSQTSLGCGHVRDRNDPAQPTSPNGRSGSYRPTEWGGLRGRMLQGANNFKVSPTCKRQDKIRSSKTGMSTAVDERCSQGGAQTLHCLRQVLDRTGI